MRLQGRDHVPGVLYSGWLEMVSTGMTMLMFTMARLMWHAGMVTVPKKAGMGDDFQVTRSTAKKIYAEFQMWQARSGLLKVFALALAYTVAFLVLRQGVSVALTVFSNPWIAGAAAAAAASVIVAPTMIPRIVRAMKNSGVKVAPAAPAESEK